MTLGFLTRGFEMSFRRFMAVILLFSPSFAWLYAINIHIFQFGEVVGGHSPDWVWIFAGKTLFLVSIICSAIIGSIISERWNRRRFLGFWILFGVITTAMFTVFEGSMFFLLSSVLAGTSFGIGFPSCLAFLADSTTIEERARVSGAVMFSAYAALVLMLGITLQFGLIEALLLTAIFRAISFFALIIDPCERVPGKKKTWVAILTTRGFGFYFISWLLFIAADGVTYFVESWLPPSVALEYESLASLGIVLTYVGVALTGLISGFVSDRFGRKKTIIFGLSTLGISYAVFGVVISPVSWLITQIIYGAAWGIVFVNYYITVIGDFASAGSKEKFYAVGGVVPLILNMTFQLFSEVFSLSVATSVVSSLLSMVLFVAVIPLLYAPETLPKEKVRRRRFREHLEKVKKLIEEEETQNQK